MIDVILLFLTVAVACFMSMYIQEPTVVDNFAYLFITIAQLLAAVNYYNHHYLLNALP